MMPAGDRRVSVTVSIAPVSLRWLDELTKLTEVSRGRVLDALIRLAGNYKDQSRAEQVRAMALLLERLPD